MAIILFKISVALIAALPVGWMMSTGQFRSEPERRFQGRMLAVQLLPAVAFFLALYVVAHREVTSDVVNFYVPTSRAPLSSQMPGSDVKASYAPLFPFVGAALLHFWDDPKAFVVFDIVLNALSLLLWHGAAVRLLGREAARESSLVFAGCGSVLVQVLLGSNQIWVSLSLAKGTWLMAQERVSSSGLTQGVALGTIKMLTLLFWPAFWLCSPRRCSWLVTAILPAVLIYGAFAVLGADLLHPLRTESALITSGNLPYVLEPLLAGWPSYKTLFDVLAAVTLMIAGAWLYLRIRPLPVPSRPTLLFAAIALLGLVFMLTSKKTFTYAAFFMYPVVVIAVTRMPRLATRLGLLLVYNVILSAEPSLWYQWRGFAAPDPSLSLWLQGADWRRGWGLLGVDAILLGCYAFLAARAIGSLRQATETPAPSAHPSPPPTLPL
jgi:hypothetical protein